MKMIYKNIFWTLLIIIWLIVFPILFSGCVGSSTGVISDQQMQRIQNGEVDPYATPTLEPEPESSGPTGLFGLPIYIPGINLPMPNVAITPPTINSGAPSATATPIPDTKVVLSSLAVISRDNSTAFDLDLNAGLLVVSSYPEGRLLSNVYALNDGGHAPKSLYLSDDGKYVYVVMDNGDREQFTIGDYGNVAILPPE